MPDTAADDDAARERAFLLAKYERDREHELELNRAVAALERAVGQVMLALNGGAAVAYLTLFGALAKGAGAAPHAAWSVSAIAAWGAGLFVAGGTALLARDAQALFSRAYRHRRRAIERHMLSDAALPLAGLTATDTVDALAAQADTDRDAGGRKLGWLRGLAVAALALFALGLCFAAQAVFAPTPGALLR